MSALQKLWCEKYRPKDVEGYIFQDKSQKTAFIKMIIHQSVPHLLLSGTAGTGKTSLAKLLIDELAIDESDLMIINASDENSVDMVRDKIMPFITSFAVGDFKIVLLEEADAMSPSAQNALKFMLEEYSDIVRFIFTCNQEHKIIPPIKSRCQQFRFKSHSIPQVEALIQQILIDEKINFHEELVSTYVALCHPDIRKTIQIVQQYSSSGTLVEVQGSSENSDYKYKLLDHIESDSWFAMRDNVLPIVQVEDWEDMYKFIYENLHRSPKLSGDVACMKGAIVVIAEYLYRHTLCADPIINASALVIRIDEI